MRLVLMLLLLSSPAPSLAETARAVRDGVAAGDQQAITYLTGVMTGIVHMDARLREEGSQRLFCPEAGESVDMGALSAMIDRADAWDHPLPEAITEGFAIAYPC